MRKWFIWTRERVQKRIVQNHMVRAVRWRKDRSTKHNIFSAWKVLRFFPNYPLDQVKRELKEIILEERKINHEKENALMKYRATLKELQEALTYADAEKDQLQERNMDLEQQMTGSKLALHHAQQQMIRLKSIIEHYQVRYPRAPLPPELEVNLDPEEESNDEDLIEDVDEGDGEDVPELPPYSPGGMKGRPSSAFNAKVKVRVIPAEAALLVRAARVRSYLQQQGDAESLKEEALQLLEYVVQEPLPLKGSKARGKLDEAQQVDRAIHWGEFMQGISGFQAGGRDVKTEIQGRLHQEREERAREGILGVATHNFK